MSETELKDVTVAVRDGAFAYVRVESGGATSTIELDPAARAAGYVTIQVAPGDTVLEVALKSTSDPDLDRARGQIWPEETP